VELVARLDNNRAPKHLLLPLKITPKLGCMMEPGACHFEGDLGATVLKCAQ
jgi:hypothetical protein